MILVSKIITQQMKLEALGAVKVRCLYVGMPYVGMIFDECRYKDLSGRIQQLNGMLIIPAEDGVLRFGVDLEI